MATVVKPESESLRMKDGQTNTRRTRTTRIPQTQVSKASQALSNISNVNKAMGKEEGDEEKRRTKGTLVEGKKGVAVVKPWESCRVGATRDKNGKDGKSKLPAPATKPVPGHGQVSVKGRERGETKGRERNETQVKERREMQETERRETQRGERQIHGRKREVQTQGREYRDVQGRDEQGGQMETVRCGRVRERARQPDTTLLRPLKVTRAVVLRQTKQILAEERAVCLVTKEIASVRSIAEPVRKTAQEIARHTQLESSEATNTDHSTPDIDLTDDPAMCGEYSLEIYQYQRCLENEEHYVVRACFLDHQVEFTAYHRQTLVDWLIHVHLRFKLLQETLFLTVDILDRYLQVCLYNNAHHLQHSMLLLYTVAYV